MKWNEFKANVTVILESHFEIELNQIHCNKSSVNVSFSKYGENINRFHFINMNFTKVTLAQYTK